jgi:hypothetical protein
MQDRRAEARMLCADIVEVTWTAGGVRHPVDTALLEDISPSGACLQLEEAAPVGASITWKLAGYSFAGKIRYCAYREIGYFVGVEFAPGLKWSQTDIEPQHLLDLQKLALSRG